MNFRTSARLRVGIVLRQVAETEQVTDSAGLTIDERIQLAVLLTKARASDSVDVLPESSGARG